MLVEMIASYQMRWNRLPGVGWMIDLDEGIMSLDFDGS